MPQGPALHVLVGTVQGAEDLSLACTRITNDKDRVSDMYQLFQLHHLQYKVVLWLQTKLLGMEGERDGGRERWRETGMEGERDGGREG